METTVPLPFLPEYDLDLASVGELTQAQLDFLGCIFLAPIDGQVAPVLRFLKYRPSTTTFVDVSHLSSIDDAVSILDAGAFKIAATSAQCADLEAYKDRLIWAADKDSQAPPIDSCAGFLTSTTDVQHFKKLMEASPSDNTVYVRAPHGVNCDSLVAYVDEGNQIKARIVPIVYTSALTLTPDAAEGKLSVAKLLASLWNTDRPDKLMPTVVTDERGTALGLVYSSEESVAESLRTGTGVYQSRKRGLWYKGATSGDTQELVRISLDCDQDCLKFVVRQKGRFCHLPQSSCFGDLKGLSKLEKTLQERKVEAPEGSYTARLFSDKRLLRAKIMEEAEELCDAQTKEDVAFEAADLLYFAMTKAVAAGVSLADIEANLDAKSKKVKRRQGDAKGKWAKKEGITNGNGQTKISSFFSSNGTAKKEEKEVVKEAASVPKESDDEAGMKDRKIRMQSIGVIDTSEETLQSLLQRPSQRSTDMIMNIVRPIIHNVQTRGDAAVLEYTHKFEKATSLTSPVLKAPFPQSLMNLPEETIKAIDVSFENIRKFHAAQKDDKPLKVETMPGVVCSRFVRPIDRVGLYVPGGTAVLPSTALMLGVPAMVAGCKKIVFASPPRADGSITPEIVYVAHKVGADSIVLAGGAQGIAAMAYGTESISKVDKILGPGNQFVTAAKMYVSNDTNAGVSIDMPAGPSEVLVIADKYSNPAFVASDLLSQAEHGVDSQVILILIDPTRADLEAIEDELHKQAMALPRVDIVRGAIEHSATLMVKDIDDAFILSNEYAPEHLILHIKDAAKAVDRVQNAGSVFIGEWTPESVGDYSAGVNHSLPTYGYAKQYSGVNLSSYVKHITSSELTPAGLTNLSSAVMQLAKVEELEAHRRAVAIRMDWLKKNEGKSSTFDPSSPRKEGRRIMDPAFLARFEEQHIDDV